MIVHKPDSAGGQAAQTVLTENARKFERKRRSQPVAHENDVSENSRTRQTPETE